MSKHEEVTAVRELTRDEIDAVAGGTLKDVAKSIVLETSILYNGLSDRDTITYEPKRMYDIK